MKIMVLGAAGMLGRAMLENFESGHQVIPRTIKDYDLRDAQSFAIDVARQKPEAVVNCAAFTRVDDAEAEEALAMEVNGDAPGRLAAVCREQNAAFVQISTDYVFDGSSNRPWHEDDPTGPLNVYGKSKLLGERTVAEAHPSGHLILRSSWLFGKGKANFVKTMMTRYQGGQRTFKVVSDQRGRPTYAPDLALAARVCLEKGLRGIYHACNAGETTWFEFANEIFSAAGAYDVEVLPVSTAEFKARAERPLYSVLDTSRIWRDAGLTLPDYRDALARYLDLESWAGASRGTGNE